MEEQHHSFSNRLIREKSPYLLQHAHNPVDWFPWGEEAFNSAKELDKPIFLSIGYATCHWCHVMERESFQDEEIAQLMNDTFICIKVDREELPEVDNLYMEFAQSMMSGAAGWPLNVILTPELEPFFAATYLPPINRHGLIGLKDLILRIQEIWQGEEREKVIQQASKIVEIFSESLHSKGDEIPEKEVIEDTAELLFKMADPVYGGIKGAPKFPIGYQVSFLISYSAIHQDSRALFLAEKTLDMLHRGGIYDHLGGGFARYATDEKWLVPHFEKMLYDNAILATAYLEAWQCTKRPLYRTVCEEILHYVLRDMTHPQGGFYSAEDSETEGQEGYFYTWQYDEIQQILGAEEAELFCEFYDVTEEGNFEDRNILNTPLNLEEFAQKKELDPGELEQLFAVQRKTLWRAREDRSHPLKDDKILTSWNGMMIDALARAACALHEMRYLEAAQKAALFIRRNLWQEGRLMRRWREGEAQYPAGLDDYAYMIRASLSLYEVAGDPFWLKWALEMAAILQKTFKSEEGAFYQTDGKDEHLILRKCQYSDGAEPSGNAIHAENLLRLYQITSDTAFLSQAEDIFKAVKKYLDNYSPGYVYHMMNLQRYYNKRAETFIIALNEKGDHEHEVFQLLNTPYYPHKAFLWRHKNSLEELPMVTAFENQKPLEGKTTLYLCYLGVCQKPLVGIEEIRDFFSFPST